MIFEAPIIKVLKTLSPSLLYILADRNGVEPKDPYVTVSVVSAQRVGRSYRYSVSKTNEEIISTPYEIQYRVVLHAQATDTAHDIFEDMYSVMESSFAQNLFYENDLGLLYVSDEILYSSAPIDTVNYKQATFDIYCSANKTSSTHADFISDVHTKGTLIDDTYEEHTLESEVKY